MIGGEAETQGLNGEKNNGLDLRAFADFKCEWGGGGGGGGVRGGANKEPIRHQYTKQYFCLILNKFELPRGLKCILGETAYQ